MEYDEEKQAHLEREYCRVYEKFREKPSIKKWWRMVRLLKQVEKMERLEKEANTKEKNK